MQAAAAELSKAGAEAAERSVLPWVYLRRRVDVVVLGSCCLLLTWPTPQP